MATNTTHYDTEELKREHPISQVAASLGLEPRRAGVDLYRTRCPFHEDRIPSFILDDRDNHYHCFGCEAHGDTLDLVMRFYDIPFVEACARLAGLQPIPSPRRGSAGGSSRHRRWDRLTPAEQVVMDAAAALYSERLGDSPRALEYLRSRGVTERVISECRLGYSDGYTLERYLARRGELEAALSLGLLTERRPEAGRRYRTQYRERLAGRVVIPEIRHGSAIWMVGRTLEEHPRVPKYSSLPGERPVLGLERAAGRSEVYAVEGPFDYLTGVKWGLAIFALCGVRLPADRLGFLSSARTVYGVFDGDTAGKEASARFRELLGDRFVPVALPPGTDLADLGKLRDGRERFRALVARSRKGDPNG